MDRNKSVKQNVGRLGPDQGIEAVQQAVGAAFVLVKIGLVALLVGFCLSGIKYLEQFEKGIILRFGSASGEVIEDPGLVLALPYPIDEVVKVPAKRTQTLESTTFWYEISDSEKETGSTESVPKTLRTGVDGFLLTADKNILHARCILKYRIKDPLAHTFSFSEVNPTLRACLDNALLKAVSVMTVQEVLNNVTGLGEKTLELFIIQIETLKIGIEADPLDLQFSWPRQLKPYISEVLSANQAAQQERSSARMYERGQADQAESGGSKIKSSADTWATRKISSANADAETFKKLYPLFKKNPKVIKQTLYQDRMRKIMANVDEIFIIEQSENREIRINLNRKGKSPLHEQQK